MAKFTIGTAELKKVIDQVSPMFVGGIDNLPRILFNVGKKVEISATNGDAYTKVEFDCDIEEEGSFVVPGKIFENIVKKSTSEKIEVSTDKNDESKLSILIGNVKYQLVLIDIHPGYFEAPEFDKSNSFSINAQDLKSAIEAVSCCVDSAKPHLNCVMIHTDAKQEGKIFIVATDGMRLGIAERNGKNDNPVPNLMVPKKSAEYIVKMLGDVEDEIIVDYTENMVKISVRGISYTTKLLDTAFPKYQSVIPTSNNKTLEVKTSDLKDTIKSISLAAEITFRIKLEIKKDSVYISCEDNGNNADGTIEGTFTEADPMQLVCNFRLLMEILENISSSIIRVQINNESTPMLIRSVDDESVKYVFMPFVS